MPIGAGFVVAYLQSWGFSPALKFLTRAIEGVVDDSKNAAYPTSYWQVCGGGTAVFACRFDFSRVRVMKKRACLRQHTKLQQAHGSQRHAHQVPLLYPAVGLFAFIQKNRCSGVLLRPSSPLVVVPPLVLRPPLWSLVQTLLLCWHQNASASGARGCWWLQEQQQVCRATWSVAGGGRLYMAWTWRVNRCVVAHPMPASAMHNNASCMSYV